MLIRRFSQHLREQNWFAVALDFLVVVLGIFIGLQVADWNQARLDRQEAEYHLSFLYSELSREIASAEAEIERSEQVLERSFQAVQLLIRDEWEEEDLQRFDDLLLATYELWGPRHRPVSLRRMIDDGKLDLIDSKALQRAILQFESAYLDAIEQTDTSYSYSLVVTPQITASVKYMGPDVISTPAELRSNETLRSAVRDKAIWQRIQFDELIKMQEARLRLKKILEDSLGESVLDSAAALEG
ncbi:MAG: hypothetical protein EP301_06035 [Gammaproteobacteria bacterium]|nr:MAG: hypothetical protein EP301_06035 [Gammaproteobacteria bacterium]